MPANPFPVIGLSEQEVEAARAAHGTNALDGHHRPIPSGPWMGLMGATIPLPCLRHGM